MSAERPVGQQSHADSAPWQDNVNKSVPPMTPGATGKHEGADHHGNGGNGYGSTFSKTKAVFERDRNDKGACGGSNAKIWGR